MSNSQAFSETEIPNQNPTQSATKPVEITAGRFWLNILIMGACVAIYMLAVKVRTDLATGWVDSAIYHALFLDLQAMQQRFGDVYFLARWPWIIPEGFSTRFYRWPVHRLH